MKHLEAYIGAKVTLDRGQEIYRIRDLNLEGNFAFLKNKQGIFNLDRLELIEPNLTLAEKFRLYFEVLDEKEKKEMIKAFNEGMNDYPKK